MEALKSKMMSADVMCSADKLRIQLSCYIFILLNKPASLQIAGQLVLSVAGMAE